MARTSAKKAPIQIDVAGRDGKPSGYSVEILPGERITVRTRRQTGSTPTGAYRINYHGDGKCIRTRPAKVSPESVAWLALVSMEKQADKAAAKAWCDGLLRSDANELHGILRAVSEAFQRSTVARTLDLPAQESVAQDWIEEHGGQRHWLQHMNSFEISEPTFTAYCETFAVGDRAEYDSYNLSYIGRILSITAKTVTIDHGDRCDNGTSRLSIYDFCWRNYDGMAGKVRQNQEWTD